MKSPSKHFLLSKTSSRRLEDVFSVTLFVFQDVFKTYLQYVFLKRLQDVLQLCLQDVYETSSRRLGRQKNVTLNTSSRLLQDVFSTSWPRRMFVGLAAADTCIIASRKTVDILPLKFSLKILKKHLFKAWFTSLV